MKNTINVFVPFEGFYETEAAMIFEDMLEMVNSDDAGAELPEEQQTEGDFSKFAQDFSKKFAESFGEMVKRDEGIELDMEFVELVSPRFYNFETDRIIATVDEKAIKELFNEKMREEQFVDRFKELITERHTSRDGFVSFYSPEFDEWRDPDEYDENKWETFLMAVQEDEFSEIYDFYNLREVFEG